MNVPVVNRTEREILIGLEPEGDTLPLAPGQTLVIKATGERSIAPEIEIDIEEGLLTVSIMCDKEVWSGDIRLR
jgi:hypothetical protein